VNPDTKHPAHRVPVPEINEDPTFKDVDTPPLAELVDPEVNEADEALLPEIADPEVNEADEALLPEILETAFTEPVEPRLIELEEPLVALDEPDVNLDPVDELTEDPDDTEDDPLLEPELNEEDPLVPVEEEPVLNVDPLLAELEDPELNEIDEPRLSVEENPEEKHPAHRGPTPVLRLRVSPVFPVVRTFLFPELEDPTIIADDPLFVELEDPELATVEEPDVNFDPEATSDEDPVEDPDKIAATLAPWSAVTEDDSVFAELEDPELKLEEADVNFVPDATPDEDPVEDPDKTTATLAPWSAVTEDDPVFVELEDPVLKEDDEPREEAVFAAVRTFIFPALADPVEMNDDPLTVELEDPELKLEEPDVNSDPDATPDDDPDVDSDETIVNLAPSAAVAEDDPVLKDDDEPADDPAFKEDDDDSRMVELDDPELMDDTEAEEPVFDAVDAPVANEVNDPRLLVFVKPEWKHPAHKGPVPEVVIVPLLKEDVDSLFTELVFPMLTTTVSTFFTSTTGKESTSFTTTFVSGKRVLPKLLSGVPYSS